MKERRLRLTGLILILFLLGGCKAVDEIGAKKEPSPQPVGDSWPGFKFSEVVAYRTNWADGDAFESVVRDGALNPKSTPQDKIKLDASQIRRLRLAVTGVHREHPIAMCLYPHHSFVFYDESGGIVGHIDICFLCSNYRGSPKENFADVWDLDGLKTLIEDLGMPIKNPAWR